MHAGMRDPGILCPFVCGDITHPSKHNQGVFTPELSHGPLKDCLVMPNPFPLHE